MNFEAIFKKHLFEVQTAVVTYWATFEKWAIFILTSGHTESTCKMELSVSQKPK